MKATAVIETEQTVVATPDTTEAAETGTAEQPLTLFDDIVAKLQRLPPMKQMEVRDFIEFLIHKAGPNRPGRSVEGLWADLDIDLTDEDIDEARREMWGGNRGDGQ